MANKSLLKKGQWREICAEHPLAWQKFVDWFKENRAAVYNHSERWVDEIKREDLSEFFGEKMDKNILYENLHFIKKAFKSLEEKEKEAKPLPAGALGGAVAGATGGLMAKKGNGMSPAVKAALIGAAAVLAVGVLPIILKWMKK